MADPISKFNDCCRIKRSGYRSGIAVFGSFLGGAEVRQICRKSQTTVSIGQPSIAFHGGLTNLPSIARLLSESERDCALECRPNSFREHCAQATFLHLVNRFGGSAAR